MKNIKLFAASFMVLLAAIACAQAPITSKDAMLEKPKEEVMMEKPTEEKMAEKPAEEKMEKTSVDSSIPMGPAWLDIALNEAKTGQVLKLSDYEGKVILVEFFATWCPNCYKQQKEVKALKDSLSGNDQFMIVLVGVDPNETGQAIAEYADKNGFPYTYVTAQADLLREVASLYGNNYLNPPSTPILIIDKKGEVHTTEFGIKSAETLLSIVNNYLASDM